MTLTTPQKPFSTPLWYRVDSEWVKVTCGIRDQTLNLWGALDDEQTSESSFLTCRLDEVEVGLERDDDARSCKARRFPTVLTLASPRDSEGAIVSSNGQVNKFRLAAASAAAFATLSNYAGLRERPRVSSTAVSDEAAGISTPDPEVVALLSCQHVSVIQSIQTTRRRLAAEGQQASDCDINSVLQGLKELHASVLSAVRSETSAAAAAPTDSTDDSKSDSGSDAGPQRSVELRAVAWLNELDQFVSHLLTQLVRLSPHTASPPPCPASAASTAADLMLQTYAQLEGIAQLCDGGDASDGFGERLIFSDVRVEECPVTQSLARVLPPRQPLMPASRVSYRRSLMGRVSM